MDKTVLTLAVDSTQVGTAAAAFERMVGAGNAAAAAGGKVTAGSLAQGRAILTTLVPAATKGKTAFNELAAAAERLDPRLSQPKSALPLAQVKPQPAQVQSDTVEPKPKRTRKTVTPDAADASATGVAKLSAESKKAKTSLDGLTTSARGTGNALTTLTSRARAAADAVKSIGTAPIKAPVGIAAVFDAASKVSPAGFSQVTAAMALTAAQAARTAAAVADANRAISAPAQIRVTAAPPSARTPLSAPSPLSAATGQRIPAAGNVAQLAGDAGRAQTAVDRLTAAARNQRSALTQLAPAAAATAVSYRQLANTPITLAAPQGLSNAAAALANATTQANNARVAIGNLNNVRAPSAPSQASATIASGGVRTLTQQQNALAQSSRQAAFQQQQLAFQLNDFFVQVASGGSPLTALIQQGSQLSGTYGGIGNAVRAVTSLLTPARLAFGGVATAVGALGYAFYEGSRQSKAFADAIVLSGNYAGQTEGQFNALTKTIAAGGMVSVSAARDAAQALIAIGQIGPRVFDKAAEALALFAQANDKTASEVATSFAKMAESPSKFAVELNRTMNLWTAQELEAIRTKEESNQATEAQIAVLDKLIPRLKQLDPNLNAIDRALRNAKNAWSDFWNSAYDVGRTGTIGDKITSLNQQIQSGRAPRSSPFEEHNFARPSAAKVGALESELQDQLLGQARQEANAFNAASKAEETKAAQTAGVVVDSYLKRAKAADQYKVKLGELERSFKAKAVAGVPVSEADQSAARGQLKKDFAGPKAGNSEASQVLRAQLDRDLKGYQDILERERDSFAFHNRFLQGEYQAGAVSLRDFYNEKRDTAAAAAAAELLQLEQERARLEQFKKATKDPSERLQTQTKIDENVSLQQKVRISTDRDLQLSNQEEAASFKALNDQVTNYRANLLQMQGDEAGAARLRAQSAISAAQVLAKQADGLPGAPKVDVNALTRAIAVTDQFNEVQRESYLLANNSARAEEAFALQAELSGKSLLETERGIYELRVRELQQLGVLAAAARKLAEDSTDPRIKAFAADLVLAYGKAAAAIDPALNRLRDANRELASGIANTVGNSPIAIGEDYTSRRLAAADDIRDQRDEYSRKIDLLEGYLATTQDKNDKARLRERIKEAEGKRDSAKGESRGSSLLGAIGTSVLKPIGEQVFATVNKLLIADPLQAYLQGQLTKLTEDKGPLAGFFKDALGIQADPKDAATALQTAAIDANRAAMNALTQAAQSAAAALSAPIPAAGEPLPAGSAPALVVDAQSDASDSFLALSRNATSAASDVSRLASAAGVGGNAMSRLPAIVNLFQSAAAAMTAANSGGSSGSGIFSAIAGMFGAASGGMDYEAAFASTGIYHQGGVVGSSPATRTVAQSVFAGAQKYHTGGIAGKAADKLKPNEVAAILMGGPKGTREEVITADDPRHRDNLGMNALAKIMAESKHEGMRVRGARELGGPVSANGMYRVNEKGPELLQVAGKQYLMTGSQGGTVTANGGGGKGGDTITVNVQVTPPAGTSAASAQQWGATAGRHIKRSMGRNT